MSIAPQPTPAPARRSPGRIFKLPAWRQPPANAASFLRRWLPAGHPFRVHTLAPAGKWTNHKLEDPDDLGKLIAQHNGTASLYFTPCVLRREPANGKATKDDVGMVLALGVDIDPPKNIDPTKDPEGWQAARADILQRLLNPPAGVPAPSVIIDSGGGYQAFWFLAEPFEVDGDPEKIEVVESRNRKLADLLGGDNVSSIEHAMRLPFTMNVPDARKVARGRVPVPAVLVKWDRGPSLCYVLEDFQPAESKSKTTVDVAEVDFRDLPATPIPAGIRDDVRKLIVGKDRPNSEQRFGVLCDLLRQGLDEAHVAAVVFNPEHGIGRAYHEDSDGKPRSEREAHRKFGVDIRNAIAKTTPEIQAQRPANAYATRAAEKRKATVAQSPTAETVAPSPDLLWLPDASRASLWSYPSGELVDRKPRPQLVKGLIYAGEIVFVYGKSNSGKSLAILDLGCAIALGESTWAGHKIRNGGPVVYVAGEGRASVEQRLHARARNRVGSGREKGELDRLRGRLSIFGRAVNLLDTVDVDAFIADLAAMPEAPCMVILDTYSRCVPGADQSATDNATAAVASMDRIRDAIGCVVLSIHHTNKGGEEFLGSIVLLNNTDVMLKVVGHEGAVEIVCDKVRDRAKERKTIELQIHGVLLGVDNDNDAVTSACVTFRERVPGAVVGARLKALLALKDAPVPCSAKLWADRADYKDATGAFAAHKRELVKSGHVLEKSGPGNQPIYSLSQKGEQLAKGDA